MDGLKLGQRVRYARLKPDGTEHTGHGAIVSFHLNVDNRPQVRVHDGNDASGKPQLYNIDMPAVNATPAGEQRYFDHVRAIQKRADEINQEVRERVTAGNKELEAMNTAYLGAPVTLEQAEEEETSGDALSA